MVICNNKDCKKIAYFNIIGGKGKWCSAHKEPGMIDVKSKKCEHNGCGKNPNYNIPSGKPKYCSEHKLPGMINVKSKQCEHTGCNKVPNFNIVGNPGKYCNEHKLVGMINVLTKRCEHSGCEIISPSFNFAGGSGILCNEHKLHGMINVRSDKCEYNGCEKIPYFDLPSGKGRFCVTHKEVGMVDVKSKKCEFIGCNIRPTFGIDGEKSKFCNSHKTIDMIDVTSRRCKNDDCEYRPIFDIIGGIGRFCSIHKTPEMVNIKQRLCEYDNCKIRVSYGNPGNLTSRCYGHRLPGMIRRPNGKCIRCKQLALYGVNYIPRHCEQHKTEDDQNLIERNCISCNLVMILNNENKCEYCVPELFQRTRLAKQNTLMSYLDFRGLPGTSTDVTINHGECGLERPDRVYEMSEYVLILECDENQHKERQCSCEQLRMVNIGQSFGGLPVYFIRWNPDDYIPFNDSDKPEILSKRHKLVGDFIESILNGIIQLPKDSLVSAFYMYYNDWSTITNEKWITITALEK